ncbi:hypothetical protein BgiBS90_012684 [Biomphalaria glabrata]|nr:hypothetical protein BgiBS90_012684 [Biomphalaria glabrata]
MLHVFLLFPMLGSVFSSVAKDYGLTVCANAGSNLIGHPEVCQRYYNCSDSAPRSERSFLGPYEVECSYPQLFDTVELKCKSFKEAKCGSNRIAAKNPCDYVQNLCGSAHCQECSSRLPSCEGLRNGMNVHPFREWTPYYIQCDTERLNGTYVCGPHDPTGTTGFFSPLKFKCVSLWEVPVSTGYGLAPSCTGKLNGYYVTKERPDVYYTCPSAKVYYCRSPFVFNKSLNRCA